MAKYGCVRTDKMSGTVNGEDLVSLEYKAGGVATAIENGNVVLIGGYKAGNREVRTAGPMEADSLKNSLALIASEEVVKTKKMNGLSDFINEAGDIIRGYRLAKSGQIFSVTAEALNIEAGVVPAAGYVIECMDGTKLNVAATLTQDSTLVGTLLAIEGPWYVIEVA